MEINAISFRYLLFKFPDPFYLFFTTVSATSSGFSVCRGTTSGELFESHWPNEKRILYKHKCEAPPIVSVSQSVVVKSGSYYCLFFFRLQVTGIVYVYVCPLMLDWIKFVECILVKKIRSLPLCASTERIMFVCAVCTTTANCRAPMPS